MLTTVSISISDFSGLSHEVLQILPTKKKDVYRAHGKVLISPLKHTKVQNDFLSQGPYHAFRLFETANFCLNCVATELWIGFS